MGVMVAVESNRKVEIPGRSFHSSEENSAPTFTGTLADTIFSKRLLKSPLPYGWSSTDVKPKYDPYNEYTLNSYNCRGPEFSSNVDFIFSGCSQTFGIGVPDDGVWPKFVSDTLGASYVNLSMLGAGMEWITDSIYRYIHTFGKPKRGIMVLAPDLSRVDSMVNNVVNSCPAPYITDYIPQYYDESGNLDLRLITFHLRRKDPVNYLKRPFPIEDTSIEEEAIRRNIKAIKDLEIFCEQIGVPLIWGTWSEVLSELANNLSDDYKFDNYLNVTNIDWDLRAGDLESTDANPEGYADYIIDNDRNESVCHSDIADSYPLSFYIGTDRYKTNDGQSHMGVHRHMHIADSFSRRALDLGI
jgi:hypothetical protein